MTESESLVVTVTVVSDVVSEVSKKLSNVLRESLPATCSTWDAGNILPLYSILVTTYLSSSAVDVTTA